MIHLYFTNNVSNQIKVWQKYFLKTLTDVFYELLVILPKFIKFLTHHESCITFLKITEKVLKKKNK